MCRFQISDVQMKRVVMFKQKVVIVIAIVCVAWFSSCSKQPVFHYKYKNAVVTRIDGDAESNFYYGNFSANDSLPKSYLKVTYPGIDGSLDGYLIFENNGVAAVHLTGSFKIIGSGTQIYIKDNLDNGKFIRWQDSITHKFDNIVRISDYIEFQNSFNAENKSSVSIQ